MCDWFHNNLSIITFYALLMKILYLERTHIDNTYPRMLEFTFPGEYMIN